MDMQPISELERNRKILSKKAFKSLLGFWVCSCLWYPEERERGDNKTGAGERNGSGGAKRENQACYERIWGRGLDEEMEMEKKKETKCSNRAAKWKIYKSTFASDY